MNLWDRWLKGVKGGEYSGVVGFFTYASYEFLKSSGVPDQQTLLACGAVACVASWLYIRNPKVFAWATPDEPEHEVVAEVPREWVPVTASVKVDKPTDEEFAAALEVIRKRGGV